MKKMRKWMGIFVVIILVVGIKPVTGRAVNSDDLLAAPTGNLETDGLWFVGQIDTPGNAVDVVIAGDHAYIADEGAGLRVVDVSDPAAPAEVGFYDTPSSANGVAVADSYAYIGDHWDGLRVVDVSNPAAPVLVGRYDTPGAAFGVAVAGSYAYVADFDAGLRVIDVSNPALPVEMGFYNTPGNALNVTFAGGYVYVADDYGGLRVVNVSDPHAPVEVGFYETPGDAKDVAIVGDYAYVADYLAGLRVVDISNPTLPIEVGSCSTPLHAIGIAVSEAYAYVADGVGGLLVVDVSFPAAPILVGAYDTSGTVEDIAIEGDLVYVADGDDGLVILRSGHSISGWVKDELGNPITGVTITATGGYIAVSDPSGAYLLADLPQGNYTVTADKAEYSFSPASLDVTLPPDAANQDFVGTTFTYSISGRVTDAQDNPLGGVTISATGDCFSITSLSGEYTLSGFLAGSYTLIPAKEGYSFTPANRNITLPPDTLDVDFVGIPVSRLFLPLQLRNR